MTMAKKFQVQKISVPSQAKSKKIQTGIGSELSPETVEALKEVDRMIENGWKLLHPGQILLK